MYFKPLGCLTIPLAQGIAGQDGKSVLNGTGAPSSSLGVNGDFYINNTNKDLYGPKTAGAWGSPTSLVGPAGAAGANGSNGTNGANGTTRLYERTSVSTDATLSPSWAALESFSLPANTLSNNGDAVLVQAWVNYTVNSPNGSFYQMRVLFGGTSATNDGTGEPILTSAIPNALYYRLRVEIIKKSSSVALCRYSWDIGGATGSVWNKQKEITGLDFTVANDIDFDVIQFVDSAAQLQSLTIDKIAS